MDLTVLERLVLRGGDILPTEGSGADMRVAGALREAFDFTPAEVARWQLRQVGGNWQWETQEPDPTAETPAAGDEDTRPLVAIPQSARFNIGDRGQALIRRGLAKLDAEQKIAGNMVTLYEKFVLEDGDENPVISRTPALAAVPDQDAKSIIDEPVPVAAPTA